MKLAVFDMSECVHRHISLAEEDITFTAGFDCVVIALKKANKPERWSSTTFEREKSAAPPFRGDVAGVVMGHASNGPLVANGYFLDLTTYQQLPITQEKDAGWEAGARIVTSADGTVSVLRWGEECRSFVLEGGVLEAERIVARPRRTGAGRSVRIHRQGGVVPHAHARRCGRRHVRLLCARGPRRLLRACSARTRAGRAAFTIFLRGLKQPIGNRQSPNTG